MQFELQKFENILNYLKIIVYKHFDTIQFKYYKSQSFQFLDVKTWKII